MCDLDDQQIIDAVLGGQRDLYGTLIDRHRQAVLRLCYGIAGNGPDAEDLAHDTFVEAYIKLGQLRDRTRFGPWLRTVALNLCRQWYRKRAKRRIEPLSDDLVAPDLPDSGAHDRLRGGLETLGASHRIALVLHYWEGLTYDEIALFLSIPVGTVMSRLYRARAELKRSMEQLPQDEEVNHVPEASFKREVDAEIATLLTISRIDKRAKQRLSVLLNRNPNRFIQLIREVEIGIPTDDLVVALHRSGRAGVTVLLTCAFASDEELSSKAIALMMRFVELAGPTTDSQADAHFAPRGVYYLGDALIEADVTAERKASLLFDLLTRSPNEQITLVLLNLLDCWSDAGFPILLERFWQSSDGDDIYRDDNLLQALCRCGTRFGQELVTALGQSDGRRRALATAGAEAVIRSVTQYSDGKNDQQIALQARFRRKWAPPSLVDRDPKVIERLAQALVSCVLDEEPATRIAALRAFGLLAKPEYGPIVRQACVHADPLTRRAALRASAEIEGDGATEMLLEVAVGADDQTVRVIVEALGRSHNERALVYLRTVVDTRRGALRTAAVAAIGAIGSEGAKQMLAELAKHPDREVMRQSCKALYTVEAPAKHQSSAGIINDLVRDGGVPTIFLSVEAAIREFPDTAPRDEREVTRIIGQACIDYSTARRLLVDDGVMTREGGVYQFTELGIAMWRVERFICAGRYRATGP